MATENPAIEDSKHEELVSKLALKAIQDAVENDRASREAEEGTIQEGETEASIALEEESSIVYKYGIPRANGYFSLPKSDVLSEINRSASIKQAEEMSDTQQMEYVMADKKAHLQEDMIRKVHQKEADEAMDMEQKEKIAELNQRGTPHIAKEEHPLSPKLMNMSSEDHSALMNHDDVVL